MGPLLDDDPRLLQAVKYFAVKQFVAKLAIEAFAISVLPRAARRDEQGLRSDLSQPVPDNLGGHFRPVVGTNVSGDTLSEHHIGEGLDDTEARDAPCDPDGRTLACAIRS